MRERPPKKHSTPQGHLAEKEVGFPFREEMFLQPWFIPKDIYIAIRSLLPNVHLAKMRYYFEDFGCMRCERSDVLYGSNGLCESCSSLVRGRVKRALERRLKQAGVKSEVRPISVFNKRMTEAQRILKDLVP
jgi:hypothetical protein